ncbi:MAG: hypothetical protein HON43_05745 [Alphaproteobacteria bacterium]|nr:hypothetical protein [Alphaproteobacteria bacterium]MBT5540166.1 hypothetical protein [Alphaproteobacteria bacterium]
MKKSLLTLLFLNLFASSFSNAEEIGIFLLPSKASEMKILKKRGDLWQNLIKAGVQWNRKENILHSSIFQGIFNKKGLHKLKKKIQILAESSQPIYIQSIPNLEDTQENIFMNLELNEALKKICDLFYQDKLFEIRTSDRILMQLTRDVEQGISDTKQKLLKKYGLHWNVPETGYNPHFTLAYGTKKNASIKSTLKKVKYKPLDITFDRIGIGKLGYHGNLLKVLYSFPLGK